MTDPAGLHRLAAQAYQGGDIARAAELLESAIKAAPARADLWVDLGPVYRRLGRAAEAEGCYRRALPARAAACRRAAEPGQRAEGCAKAGGSGAMLPAGARGEAGFGRGLPEPRQPSQ